MSEVYNPETVLFERLQALLLDARRLRVCFDEAESPSDRRMFEKQLEEVERRVDVLRHRLRSGRRARANASLGLG